MDSASVLHVNKYNKKSKIYTIWYITYAHMAYNTSIICNLNIIYINIIYNIVYHIQYITSNSHHHNKTCLENAFFHKRIASLKKGVVIWKEQIVWKGCLLWKRVVSWRDDFSWKGCLLWKESCHSKRMCFWDRGLLWEDICRVKESFSKPIDGKKGYLKRRLLCEGMASKKRFLSKRSVHFTQGCLL